MLTQADTQYLKRAIALAMRGRGLVEPNPMVACVIVKDNRVIGEGYHAAFGGPHAEPTALANCTQSPKGATAYVTLEPCCHNNKKTPPCAPKLVQAGISRVVVGCLDPNPDVNGKGIAQLIAAGIVVDIADPELRNECQQLIAPFVLAQQNKLYTTLKWAETADGKVAGHGGSRLQISCDESSKLVHQLRSRCDVIAVGVQTVLTDDPMLTARGTDHKRPIARWILDRMLRTPIQSKLVQSARDIPTIIFTEIGKFDPSLIGSYTPFGVQIIPLKVVNLTNATLATNHTLNRRAHLLVEPGPTLAKACFDANEVDRLWVFRSSRLINDPSAPSSAPIPSHFITTGSVKLGQDTLTEYLNPNSQGYVAAHPSADFALIESAK